MKSALSFSISKLRVLMFVMLTCGVILHAAQAATFTVTSLADPGNGACTAASTDDGCTLREAIGAANAAAGADTIDFAAGVSGTIQLTAALPDLSTDITLQGPGANVLTVRGQGTAADYTVFVTTNGTATFPTISISGLTIANGRNTFNAGGIANDSALTLTNVVISGNHADNNGGGIFHAGGGGLLTIINSTISGNSAGSQGGALYNGGEIVLINSTLSGNNAGAGGAIAIISNPTPNPRATAHVQHSTFNSNTSTNEGSLFNDGDLTIGNTILNNGTATNYSATAEATLTDEGYNLSSDATGPNNGTTDKINTNPQLGPLVNNGGTTPTHALLSNSPAINAGDPAFTPPPSTDQRGSGFPRVQGGRLDIGAYEATITATLTVNDVSITEANGGSVQAQFTITLSSAQVNPVTVSAKTGPGGSPEATAGADYTTLTATTVTFAPGELSKTVSVTVQGDTLDENDEKFALLLSSPTNATILDGTGIGTILDNDAPPSISASAANTVEGNSVDGVPGTTTMVFTLKLSTASARNISVQYQTANATTNPATAGSDYTAVPLTTIIFQAGETTKTVNVTVKGDLLDEENERIKLNLSNPVNATLGTSTDGIIVDDDAAPSLSINDQSANEGQANTRLMNFTVTLSAPSSRTVTVNVQTGNGGTPAATAGVDYLALSSTPITFAPGQTSKQVSITIYGDTTFEPNEKFGVILSGAVNATIADNGGIGTILNDDAPGLIAPLDDSSS